MTYRALRPRALLGVACVSLAIGALGATTGCGLISSDTSSVDLTLPDKMYTVDASGWQVDGNATPAYFAKSCAAVPTLCATAAQTACSDNTCAGSCGTGDVCDLTLQISLWRPVDLVTETPDVKTASNAATIAVTIDSVTYDVADNSLNLDTPMLTIYIGPSSVMSPNDPMAKAIGTIGTITAGAVTDSAQQIDYTATGKAELAAAMSAYKTPFNVIVGASLTLSAGDPVPTGKLDAVVHIDAHAAI